MHILHITLGFYPAQAWGGPVKVVHQNGKELVRRGHRVTVYCTNLLDKRQKMGAETFEKTLDGMRIVYFDTLRIRSWPGTLGPFWLPDLPAYLKRELWTFDIVHLNGYRGFMMMAAARAARRGDVPIVTQPHGTLPIITNSFWVKRLYDWMFGSAELKSISTLIALQESERQQALAHGIRADRIEIVPNGIDHEERQHLPKWGSFRRQYGLDLKRALILFLARINKKKGTDMLIEAFARLKGPDAQLAVVGPDDGQLFEVQRLIQKYSLEKRVILPGLLSGQDVLTAFQDADLFVLPCRADTFPVTIMEACLMGTPMVITDRCEIAHLVKDRVGDVVPFDASAFAAAMQRLLIDRKRYNRYCANCHEMIANTFSIEAVVDHLESIYQRVIAERTK
jgi:glycosyltransferase involved in cell wall biosynthesis